MIFYQERVGGIYYPLTICYIQYTLETKPERRCSSTLSYTSFLAPLPPLNYFFLPVFPSYPGIFTFEGASQRVSESVGVMEVKVLRTSGARGLVAVPYRTVDGTARGGEDYELAAGKLEFQNDETM